MKHWVLEMKNKTAYEPIINEIRVESENLLQEGLQEELTYSLFQLFEQTGSRQEYEKAYFRKRRRLNTFAIMLLLEPDENQYLVELENIIWSICNEYTWCLPAHLQNSAETTIQEKYTINGPQRKKYTIDLFSAETAFSLSEIYMLTKDYLSPLIGRRICEEVYNRIFFPFLTGNFKWETETHNWASVCAGSIGAAALHLIEDRKELATIIQKVLPVMDSYLKGIDEDGICMEGYSYWQYGFGFYVYFADLLKKKTEGKVDLFHNKKVHQLALFQQRCFMAEDLVVNFSDSPKTSKVYIGMSHYLANCYPDVHVPAMKLRSSYTDDPCSRWAPSVRSLLWFDETLQATNWKEEAFISESAQWLVSRYHSKKGSFSFAAKGGHNDEPHNHNDLGHFILQGGKEVFLKDLGSGLYTKDYFNKNRYSYLCNSSKGHSVPILNGQFQQEGKAYHAEILYSNMEGNVEILELDLTKAYGLQSLESYQRKFEWIKGNYAKLIMTDTFCFTQKPDSVVERFILPDIPIKQHLEGVSIEGYRLGLDLLFDTTIMKMNSKKTYFINHNNEREKVIILDLAVCKPIKESKLQIEFQFKKL